jgi:AcrR family transcriptional regulator
LIGAARELLAEGRTPTVEDVADRAGTSRTTAYRYFPNQRALLIATYPETELRSQLGPMPPADPAARLELAVQAITRQVLEHEPELRAQLRISLEPGSHRASDLPFRQGRAIGWLEEALAPLQASLGRDAFRRLVLAVRTTIGIEALVWLTDVAGLSRDAAIKQMRWTAGALLSAVLEGIRGSGEADAAESSSPVRRKSRTSPSPR